MNDQYDGYKKFMILEGDGYGYGTVKNEAVRSSDRYLILEGSGCAARGCVMTMNLNESIKGKGLTTFRGKFQEAEGVNKNQRIYPYAILDHNVKGLQDTIKHRGLVGELDHPTDSIVHFEKTSHVVTKLWWEGNNLMGEGEILDTPHGNILKALLDADVRVGISSRGVGSGKVDENGILVIGESYKLITFDAVADPSTREAFQEKVVGSKKESYNPRETSEYVAKNNDSGIHKFNKETIIAWAGGFINQQTSNLKARLA